MAHSPWSSPLGFDDCSRDDNRQTTTPERPISGEDVPEHSDDVSMTVFGPKEQRIQAGSVGEEAHDR